jgi:hypothetical protein
VEAPSTENSTNVEEKNKKGTLLKRPGIAAALDLAYLWM